MFEDKSSNSDNLGRNRFFMPDDNPTGLNTGNDNLNFKSNIPYVPEPTPIKKKQKKEKNPKKFLIIILLVIIVLFAVGIYFGVMAIFTSPYKIYTKVLNEAHVVFTNKLKDISNQKLNYDLELDTLNNTGEIKLNTDYDKLKKYNNYSYAYKFNFDVKNEQFDVNFKIKDKEKSVIDLKAYLRNEKLYFLENKILDKLIYIDTNMSTGFDNKVKADYNDILNVTKVVNNYIISNLNKDNLTKEKATVKINNNMLKVNNSVYILSKEEVKNTFLGIIDAIVNDSNAVKSLSAILNKPVRDIPDYLNSFKEDKELLNNFENLKFNVYTKGLANSFVGIKLESENKEVFSYFQDGSVSEINFVGTFTINNKSAILDINLIGKDNKWKFEAKQREEVVANGIITKEEDNININYNIIQGKIFENNSSGEISIERKKIGDKRQTLKVALNLTFIIDDEKVNFNVNIDNMTQVGTKIESINTDSSLSLGELTQSDIENVITNLGLALQGTEFFDIYQDIKDLLTKEEDNRCEMAYDCVCTSDSCECKYEDDAGVIQSISCSALENS